MEFMPNFIIYFILYRKMAFLALIYARKILMYTYIDTREGRKEGRKEDSKKKSLYDTACFILAWRMDFAPPVSYQHAQQGE